MRIDDLRHVNQRDTLECDLCIVGAGPAGLTLATELASTSLRVLVLESGSKTGEDSFAAGLNEIESIGASRIMQQREVRNRGLGGSSATWFGRCTSLDSIDFEVRPWVPYSGWPITEAELAPYLQRSVPYLGLDPALYTGGLPSPSKLAASLRPECNPEVRLVAWQFSSRSTLHSDYVRFGSRFTTLHADNIRVLTHATLTELETTPDGRHVTALEVSTPQGRRHRLQAAKVVLCGGGIENARLLLISNRFDHRGVGNGHGRVGRFFMDHPRTTVGCFTPEAAPAVQGEFGLFRAASGVRVQCGLSLALDVQRREKLLNCAAWTTQHVADNDAWRSIRRVGLGPRDERLAAAKVVVKNLDQLAAGIWRKLVLGRGLIRRFKHLDLDVMVEQTPDPESCIRLASRCDAMGVRLSQIDWKIGEMERRSVITLSHAVNAVLAHSGLPQAELVDWVKDRRPDDAVFYDPAHPLGATRMASRAEDGVVDRDGKVFGLDNLYIAGSSIFPTGGHANPTLTIVALALRLADHLQASVRG